MKKILVVAAHPDDEILGLGATIRKKVSQGAEAHCLILGEGMTSRASEEQISDIADLYKDSRESAKIIGFKTIDFSKLPDNKFDSVDLLSIVKIIESKIQELEPSIIYTHHHGDLNIDHQLTYEAVITATRPIGDYSVQEIYTFETPSSTEWNFNDKSVQFNPNHFEVVDDYIDVKLKAMLCYESELKEYPHPRSLEALKIIAARWGTVVGKKYVEAFQLIRRVNS